MLKASTCVCQASLPLSCLLTLYRRAHTLVKLRAPSGVRGWFVRGCFGGNIDSILFYDILLMRLKSPSRTSWGLRTSRLRSAVRGARKPRNATSCRTWLGVGVGLGVGLGLRSGSGLGLGLGLGVEMGWG